jgi:hypothetical protein
VQALDEHEPRSVSPYEDWRLKALVENARGDLVYALLVKGGAPFQLRRCRGKVARFIIAKHYQNLPSKSVRRILSGHGISEEQWLSWHAYPQYVQLSLRFVENHIDSGLPKLKSVRHAHCARVRPVNWQTEPEVWDRPSA